MARVTIEDCIETSGENRFNIILAAAKRAHQLNKSGQATVPIENDKPTVIALREIAAGTVDVRTLLEQPDLTDFEL